jgi:hypothetical protein
LKAAYMMAHRWIPLKWPGREPRVSEGDKDNTSAGKKALAGTLITVQTPGAAPGRLEGTGVDSEVWHTV